MLRAPLTGRRTGYYFILHHLSSFLIWTPAACTISGGNNGAPTRDGEKADGSELDLEGNVYLCTHICMLVCTHMFLTNCRNKVNAKGSVFARGHCSSSLCSVPFCSFFFSPVSSYFPSVPGDSVQSVVSPSHRHPPGGVRLTSFLTCMSAGTFKGHFCLSVPWHLHTYNHSPQL